MTYKLLTWAPHPEDATSLVRCHGVLPRMRKFADIDIIRASGNINWTQLVDTDGLFLQRGFMPNMVQLLTEAKKYKVPICCDWDDDLFTVPSDNPTHATYGQPWSKQNVETIARMADLITVSTAELQRVMLKFNPNVHVVENALDLKVLPEVSRDLPRNPVVCWRGGHTHVRDLRAHTNEIMDAYNQFPNYSWVFLGYDPWWITEQMNPTRFRIQPFNQDYINYMTDMTRIRAAIQIVPLVDSPFNRAKSRIAHIEATMAGSVVLGPDFEEWQTDGVVTYKNPADFKGKLFELMGTPFDTLAKKSNENWSLVKAKHDLDIVTKRRVELFQKYMGLKC